jgi:hypothetical protein
MRGVLLGLVLLPLVAIAILSIRPGGIRQQLRLVRRRFKIALVLGGAYVAFSMVARFLVTEGNTLDYIEGGVAVLLGITFVVLAQDPAEARR